MNKQKSNEPSKKKLFKEFLMNNKLRIYTGLAIFIIIIGVLSIVFYPMAVGSNISDDPKIWSYYGQYLGGVLGPLFGLLAFIGVLISISNQKIENDKINKENIRQAIETRILKQIEFHHNICKNVKVPYDIKRTKFKEGSLAFEFLYEKHLKTYFDEVKLKNSNYGPEQVIKKAFDKLYVQEGQQFGFYFRNLFYLIKYIHENPELEDSQKIHFIMLIRAQLSTSELQILMYNCFTEKGKQFMDYVKKYDLLNGLDDNDLIIASHKSLINSH